MHISKIFGVGNDFYEELLTLHHPSLLQTNFGERVWRGRSKLEGHVYVVSSSLVW